MFEINFNRSEAEALAQKIKRGELDSPQAISGCDFYVAKEQDSSILAFSTIKVEGQQFKIGALKS